MKRFMTIGTILALLCVGCATPQKTGQTMQAVAITAPTIGRQLPKLYKTLEDAKLVPAYQEEATKWLAALDIAAPVIVSQGEALSGDTFNWTACIVQAAIAAVKVMGLWL